MKRLLRVALPLAILGASAYTCWWFIVNRPETPTVEAPPAVVRVEATALRSQDYPVTVRSQGTVQARTRSTLLPEVSGKILKMSPSFKPGGFFQAGEVLLELDPVDYETAVVVARATQAQAEVVLAEEKARASQAVENWRALGKPGQPGSLALRQPQVAKAEADVASARAQIAQAERNLDRTRIRAPYDGQVLEQLVDVGQFVNVGTSLGQIFAVDYVEIRLPLPEREIPFLTLPERFRDGTTTSVGPKVILRPAAGGEEIAWEGRIVRVEGAIDESTRQVTAVAQVRDPYARREDGTPPLRIGQFLEAEIAGETLTGVFVIPRRAVRAGNEILLINPDNKLHRVRVAPIIADTEQIVVPAIGSSPKEGDILCLTPIPFAAEGATVLPVVDGVMETTGPAGPNPQPGPPAGGAAPRSS